MMPYRLFAAVVLMWASDGQALLSVKVPLGSTSSAASPPSSLPPTDLPERGHPLVTMKAITTQKSRERAKDYGMRSTLAAAGLALSLFLSNPGSLAADPGIPGSGLGCTTSTNPSYSLVSCNRTGLDRNGRLLGCSSSENCLSTSAVKVPGKLGSPWEYAMRTDDADTAFASLVHAVERLSEATMKIVDRKGHYILAEFPSKVPPGSVDSVEFLVKPEDQIVLYRSVSRDTLFLYPLQQPVSDQGKIKERLEGIRKDLGWNMYTYRGE